MTIYDDGAQEDIRGELAYHASLSRPPCERDNMIARYMKLYDEPDRYTCDVVYFDRISGAEVMRYDGADPLNTNPFYGAETDSDCFARKGLDLNEMISRDADRVPDHEIRAKVSVAGRDDGDWYD